MLFGSIEIYVYIFRRKTLHPNFKACLIIRKVATYTTWVFACHWRGKLCDFIKSLWRLLERLLSDRSVMNSIVVLTFKGLLNHHFVKLLRHWESLVALQYLHLPQQSQKYDKVHVIELLELLVSFWVNSFQINQVRTCAAMKKNNSIVLFKSLKQCSSLLPSKCDRRSGIQVKKYLQSFLAYES